jgi:hypothetical protein
MTELERLRAQEAANDEPAPRVAGARQRERTVPIPQSLTPVPGYPQKLVVFKMAASRFWQMRCWMDGRSHRRSARTESLRLALHAARLFYEEMLARKHSQLPNAEAGPTAVAASAPPVTPSDRSVSFGHLAENLMRNERARTQRGEWSLGSWQVMRNRLDAALLPRWADVPVQQIDHQALLELSQDLSTRFSTTTVSQYLVVVRKVLNHALASGLLIKLPVFPKIKIHTTPRGAFTPSEYWQIIRCARRLRGRSFPMAGEQVRQRYKIRRPEQLMPPDLAWAIGFMLHSFIRPSDLKTLKHRHVEIVLKRHHYLRLTLPETKSHDKPIVTLQPAVRIYRSLRQEQIKAGYGGADDYLFLPQIKDRHYAHWVLNFHFNWVLSETGLKKGPHGQSRSLYSLRHSAITFRLLYGQGIDLLTLARNARTSVDVINRHYASTVTGEQNIGLLQSRRRQRSR